MHFFVCLKNEVTVLKATPTIKKNIWELLGLIVKRFNSNCPIDSEEVKGLMLKNIEKEFGSKKPEVASLIGCLKGLSKFIKIVEMTEEESLQVIEEVSKYEVVQACLKLFSKYAEQFIPLIEGKEADIINVISAHLESKNRPLKLTASAILVNFCTKLSLFISENSSKLYYQELLNFLLRRLRNIILKVEDPNVLITCIQSYGSFAKAVKTIHGDKKLHECLHFLIENTEATLFTKLDRFENFDFEKNPQNFKAVLFNQKQLISYLRSLAFVLVETSSLENYEVHFIFKIVDISIKYLTNYFPPYVKSLCESFSLFLNSLPAINYNKVIFKRHITTIIDSMQRHCEVNQLSSEKQFREYYESVLTEKLSLDKQSISIEQFIKILFSYVEKPDVKSIDVHSIAKMNESSAEKQFYFIIMIFLEIMQKDHFIGLLEVQGKTVLNLFFIAETKLLNNPKNFLMLRLISALMNLSEVRAHVNYSKETKLAFLNLIELIENTKNEYKDYMCIHQEFMVTAFQICRDEPIVELHKRFLMSVFLKSIESKILIVKILASIKLFLSSPSSITDCEKQNLLSHVLKFASKFIESDNDNQENQGLLNRKRYVLYLNDDTTHSEDIFNKILDIVKLFKIEGEYSNEEKRDSFMLTSSSLISQKYLFMSSVLNFSNENLFIHIAQDVFAQKIKITDPNVSRLLHMLGKEIYSNYRTSIAVAKVEDHKRFTKIVKTSLKLLKVSTESTLTGNEQIFELNLFLFKALFTSNPLSKETMVKMMQQAKKLYISDYDKLNVNNRTFLEIVCLLFRTCLCQSSDHSKGLPVNESSIQEILDFVKINVYSPYESIQIFNIQMYEILFNFLVKDFAQTSLLNSFFEIFISIVQAAGDKNETCSFTMKKAFEKLYEISLVLSTNTHANPFFDVAKASAFIANCIASVCSNDKSCLLYDKLKLIIRIACVDSLNKQANECIDDLMNQPTIDELSQFRLKLLRVFVQGGAETKTWNSIELLYFFKHSLTLSGMRDEFKTFILLLLNYGEMSVVNPLLENRELLDYFITLLFEGTHSINDKYLKLSIERLAWYLTENEKHKLVILPMIVNNEFKKDLLKNMENFSRHQFHRKLQSLYCFLKAFTKKELRAAFTDDFIQLIYGALKNIMMARHETSLEYNKAKSLFNLMLKIGLIDAEFCFEVIHQDKVTDFAKILHKNINRFHIEELHQIFSEVMQLVLKEKDIFQMTRFLQAFKDLYSDKFLDIQIDISSILEDTLFFENNINHILNFLITLSDLKIRPVPQNVDLLRLKLNHLIQDKSQIDVFLLLKFIDAFGNASLSTSILRENYKTLLSQMHKDIPMNLSSLPTTSKDYEHFADCIHHMFSISAQIKSLDYLSLVYFLIPDESSVFNQTFEFDAKEFVLQFSWAVDFKAFVIQFIDTLLRSNQKDQENIDHFLCVSAKIIEPFLIGMSNSCITPILTILLKHAFSVMEMSIEHSSTVSEANDLLIKKTVLCKLADLCMSKLSKSEIVDIVFEEIHKKFFWDNKTPGLVTKKIGLLLTQGMGRSPQIEAKLKTLSAMQAPGVKLFTHEKLDKLLRLMIANTYNLLVTLMTKTQSKTGIILTYLLYNDLVTDKELLLANVFPDNYTYDFAVTTEYQCDSQVFFGLDINIPDNQTFIEAFGTFNSRDQQMTFSDLQSQHLYAENNQSSNQFEIENGDFDKIPNAKDFNFVDHVKRTSVDKKPQPTQVDNLIRPIGRSFERGLTSQSIFSIANASHKIHSEKIIEEEKAITRQESRVRQLTTILFELDEINQHPCTRKFITLIATLIERNEDESLLISKLVGLLNLKSTTLNLRLFIFKIIFNLRRFFSAHKDKLNIEIMKYLALPVNGGKGLHYFYRDMCCLFIDWNKDDDKFAIEPEHRETYEKAMLNMISKLGDLLYPIFESNLQMFKSMIGIMKSQISIDTDVIFKLLKVEGQDRKALIWKTVGLFVLDCMIEHKLGIFAHSQSDHHVNEEANQLGSTGALTYQADTDAFSLLVKPFLSQQRQPRNEKTNSEVNPKDKANLLTNLEKMLYSLIGSNSRKFVQVLGMVFGKLSISHLDISAKNVSTNDQLALNILEAYPRVNERFFILLDQIIQINEQFYLRNPCFRKFILDIHNFSNDKMTRYISKIIWHSLKVANPMLESEKMFLINDTLDAFPQLIKTSNPSTILNLIDILTQLVDTEMQSFAGLISTHICSIWTKKNLMMTPLIKSRFKGLCRSFITKAFQTNLNTSKIAKIFYFWLQIEDSPEEFTQCMNEIQSSLKFEKPGDMLSFLLGDSQDIQQAIQSFCIFVVKSMQPEAKTTMSDLNALQEVINFKQLVQEQLQLPINYLSQDFSEHNFSQWSQNSIKSIVQQSNNKETLKVGLDILNVSTSEYLVDSDNEDVEEDKRVNEMDISEPSRPTILRFNKKNLNIMPKVLLKKYAERNRISHRTTFTLNEEVTQGVQEQLIRHLTARESNVYMVFALLMQELVKTATLKEKTQLLNLLIKITSILDQKKIENSVFNDGYNLLIDLLYYLIKEIDIIHFLDAQNLKALNQLSPCYLQILINEYYLLKLHTQSQNLRKNKADVDTYLPTFINYTILGEKAMKERNHIPLNRNDAPSLGRPIHKSEKSQSNGQNDSELMKLVLDKTMTNLFTFDHHTELNTFYKPFIRNEADYEQLLIASNSNLYRQVIKVIDSIDEDDEQNILESLMFKQKQECFAFLEKWDKLVELTSIKNENYLTMESEESKLHIKSIASLPAEDQDYVLQSCLLNKNYWKTFQENTNVLMNNKDEREHLEKIYPTELAFLSLTKVDYDRTNYYNELLKDKIKRLIAGVDHQSISNVTAQINTYNKIQSFLHFVAENNFIADEDQFKAFIQNFKVDKHRFSNAKTAQFNFSLNNLLLNVLQDRYRTDCTEEMTSLLIENQINFAANLVSLNFMEASEKRLKTILASKDDLLSNERLTFKFLKCYANMRQNSLPVLTDKSKIKSIIQFFAFCKPVIVSEKRAAKFKLIKALFAANCIKFSINLDTEATGGADISNDGARQVFLKKSDEIMKIDKIVSTIYRSNHHHNQFDYRLSRVSGRYESVDEQNNELKFDLDAYERQMVKLEIKSFNLHEKLSEITQLMLRVMIDGKQTSSPKFDDLIRVYFKNTSIILENSPKASHKLPFMFKLLKSFPQKSIGPFSEYSKSIGLAIWLDWIPQLVQFMDPEYGCFSSAILQELILNFPDQIARHLVFYKNLRTLKDLLDKNSCLLNPYFELFEEFKLLNDPELTLQEILNDLKLTIESKLLEKIFNQAGAIVELMSEVSLAQSQNPSSKIFQDFDSVFIPDIHKLLNLLTKVESVLDIVSLINSINVNIEKTVRNRYLSADAQLIQYFSEKLANFTTNFSGKNSVCYFLSPKKHNRLTAVVSNKALKIIDMKSTISVMNSLRKPKKITFLCSDNKVRSLLFKSGEDLREDQRIMTIFKLFNSLLDKQQMNNAISYRISCYEVLPITRNDGLLEWVPNSFSLKSLIESEMGPSNLNQNPAMHQRQSFLNKLGNDPVSKHLATYKLDSFDIIKEFDTETEYLQSGLLRKAMIKKLKSAAEFFETRKQLFGSYALSSLTGYLLGIGDRHLDNILFNNKLELYQIDFGCSFNFGLHLSIPELVPFRFSPCLIQLGQPFEIEGTFKSTYLTAANQFYSNHDVLNDYVEIYLSEPVENWQKLERRYGLLMSIDSEENGINLTEGLQSLIDHRLSVFNRKLRGDCPRDIMVDELQRSMHRTKPYFNDLIRALKGTGSPRREPVIFENSVQKISTNSREVIKMAIDKTLLGRMWTGWMPFA